MAGQGMCLQYVCVEVRQNVGCAYVFLQFSQSLSETHLLKIHLQQNALNLREYATTTSISTADYFDVDATTLSNLAVESQNASFRMMIKNLREKFGNSNNSSEDSADVVGLPQVPLQQPVDIICSNCKQSIFTAPRNFDKMREMPSTCNDLNELFCHSHGADLNASMVPACNELFFGFHFLVVNCELLSTHVRQKEKHLYCRRCLQYLGELTSTDKAAKLWTDMLLLNKAQQASSVIFECSSDGTLNYELLHKIVKDTVPTCKLPLALQTFYTKILLETTNPSRQSKFLLLHVLERNLRTLRNLLPLSYVGCTNNNNDNVVHVTLTECKAYKLLFRFIDARENWQGDDAKLLSVWQSSIAIQLFKVSPMRFSHLLQELQQNALLLPEQSRHNDNDFVLSYVFDK